MKAKFRDGLERMYWLKGKTITVVIEKLKHGIIAKTRDTRRGYNSTDKINA